MYPCTHVPMYHVHQIHSANPQPSQPEAALVSVVLAPLLICSARGEVQRRASTDILRCPTSTSKNKQQGSRWIDTQENQRQTIKWVV